MSAIEVIRGEEVVVGRADYGWGVPGVLVEIGEEQFVEVRGTLYVPCGMCSPDYSGSKTWAAHVLGGVCFQCNGHGVHRAVGSEAEAVKIVKRRVADRARRSRKAEQEAAERAAALVEWVEANPEVVAMLSQVRASQPHTEADPHGLDHQQWTEVEAWREQWGGFLTELAQQVTWKPLSEKQAAAVPAAFEEAKAEQAAAAAKAAAQRHYGQVGDKVAITGTVAVATSVEHASFSGYGTEHSMLVVVEGTGEFEGVTVKVFGKGQSLWEAERGTVVVISGTIKDHAEREGVPQTVLTRAKVVTA